MLLLVTVALPARGQGYGSSLNPLRRTYYIDDPANSICAGPQQSCSIIECDVGWSCVCVLAFPNGAKQPLSAEQCRAASRELPRLPPDYFKARPAVTPDAECRWRSKGDASPVDCRYGCQGASDVVKITLPSGMVRCPGEDGAALRWGQIHGVVIDPANSMVKREAPTKAPAPVSIEARLPPNDSEECTRIGEEGTGSPERRCHYKCGNYYICVRVDGKQQCPDGDPKDPFTPIKFGKLARLPRCPTKGPPQ